MPNPKIARAAPFLSAAGLVAYRDPDLAVHVFPERKILLMRGDAVIFRAGHLGQIYAPRGVGKTWFAQTLAYIMATGCPALSFTCPEPCRVLLIDGEMASEELQSRLAFLRERLGIPPSPNLTVLAADWQEAYLPRLDTGAGQLLVEPFVQQADVIFLDNRSSLFDPEGEKDPTAYQPTQDWLLSLRRRGKGVWVVHHSNRMGASRGHSKAEDPLNVIIGLARPDDYHAEQGARFVGTFEKTRGAHGSGVADFLAHLTATGWQMDHGDWQGQSVADRLVEYVTLARAAGDPVKSANAAIQKVRVRRDLGLKAWAQLLEQDVLTRSHDGGFVVVPK